MYLIESARSDQVEQLVYSLRPVGHPCALKYSMINVVMQLVVGDDLIYCAAWMPDHYIGVHTGGDSPFAVLETIELCGESRADLDKPLRGD